MPIQDVETRRIYQQIAEQLRVLIEVGEFPVGRRLPGERDLADKFKVSRPSVREALIMLEVTGLVQIRMGSGVYVCEPAQAQQKGRAGGAVKAANGRKGAEREVAPFELIQARHLVEAEVAAQAALVCTPEQVASIAEAINMMAAAAKKGQSPLKADRLFHLRVAQASGNQVLSAIIEQLFEARLGRIFSQLSAHFETGPTWDVVIKEHRAVLRALKARDPEAAKLAMRHHMERAYKRFSASLDGKGRPNLPQ
ncbi:MAG: FadR family transcriptional regulator [Candidatus Protistobacter heckmanni]|nr:FadR family transcriptional regulator [Candidatus Protistobacter heckmanni]